MKTTFLDYYKTVLDKVSFDHQLFAKEYRKAIERLDSREVKDLNGWLQSKGFQPILSNTTGAQLRGRVR